jgi:hypothetical protein
LIGIDSFIRVENCRGLKTAAGFGVIVLLNWASIAGGKKGVSVMVGVSVIAGVSVIVGVSVMVGETVMVYVSVMVDVGGMVDVGV